MTGKELLEKLQMLKKDELDLKVRLYADHGQCPMEACEVYIGCIDEETYMPERIDMEDASPEDTRIIMIEG